uniref:Cytochrome P450 n=1 Tax=Chironomus tentans TaxID=7153 RepID=A0A1W6R7G7_CHITE|nr:cytochrome P450 [Chironomus tentans]
MYTIFYFIIAILSLAYIFVKRQFNYWKNRGFLQADASFPLGTYQGCGTKWTSFEGINMQYKKFKGKAPAIGIYSFLSPSIFVLDPDLLKDILVRDFGSFHDRGMYYNKKDDPISANLLSLDGQEWRDRRTKLSPIFTSGKMKMMFEIVDRISDKLAEELGRQLKTTSEFEMRNWSQRYTGDNIGNVAFGIECNCIVNENSDFMKYGRPIFDLSPFDAFMFIFTIEFPNLSRKLGLRDNPKESGDFFLNTFLQTLEYRQRNNIQRNDFVSLLLGLKDSYTSKELAAEAYLVYAAGFETSSTLMTFTLYELALNPDIQDRLREEITTGIEENDGKLNYDMLFGFKYLDMIINESLRKFPPIAENLRKCIKDYEIPGTDLVIPKGTSIDINIFSLHRDPEYFPDPEKFDPERFSEENIKNIRPFTFLPFGEGPRNCIGMRFGQMQSKIGITKLIKNFKFSPCDKTPIPMVFDPKSLFTAPKGGMWLKVEKIKA